MPSIVKNKTLEIIDEYHVDDQTKLSINDTFYSSTCQRYLRIRRIYYKPIFYKPIEEGSLDVVIGKSFFEMDNSLIIKEKNFIDFLRINNFWAINRDFLYGIPYGFTNQTYEARIRNLNNIIKKKNLRK